MQFTVVAENGNVRYYTTTFEAKKSMACDRCLKLLYSLLMLVFALGALLSAYVLFIGDFRKTNFTPFLAFLIVGLAVFFFNPFKEHGIRSIIDSLVG